MRISLIIVLIAGNVQVFGQLATDSLFSPLGAAKNPVYHVNKGYKESGFNLYQPSAFLPDCFRSIRLYKGKNDTTGKLQAKRMLLPTPMDCKIDKKNAKNTLFEGNKKLKWVLACDKFRQQIMY